MADVPVGAIIAWHKHFDFQEGASYKTVTSITKEAQIGWDFILSRAGEDFTTSLEVGDWVKWPTGYGELKAINNDTEIVVTLKNGVDPDDEDLDFYKRNTLLSGDWVECNGQEIDDSESPFNGYTVPDLNGDARFLRGGNQESHSTNTVSGTNQADAFQGHWHQFGRTVGAVGSGVGATAFASGTNENSNVYDATEDNDYSGEPRTDDETRPVNMSVVWIMRIK